VKALSPLELLGHRVLWSVAFVVPLLALSRRRSWRGIRPGLVASAACLAVNWFVFIWAVNSDRGVDASLGYFINPLLTIALGALLLGERLTRLRWLAVVWASLGVMWLTVQFGQVPWIGLALAASFAAYGFLRKTSALGALEGVTLELAVLSPFAFGYLGWQAAHGGSHLSGGGLGLTLLVLLAGPVTALPLLLFGAGARRIPLWLVGLLQYIGPTLQLLLGTLVRHEPFGPTKLVGYALIWFAFLLASAESVLATRPAPTERCSS
jgi:chloramphenicol-sensitive protein RarD